MANNTELEQLKDRIQELSATVEKMGKKVSANASENIEEYTDKASKILKETWDTTRDSAKETTEKVHKYAKENPWQVAAAAAAIGAIVASLLVSKKKN